MNDPNLMFDPARPDVYLARFGHEYNRVSQELATLQADLAAGKAKLEIDRATTFLRVRGNGTVKDGETLTNSDPAIVRQAAGLNDLEARTRSLQYYLRAMYLAHQGAVTLAGGRRQPDMDHPVHD